MKAWARSTGHQYLGMVEEAEVLKHYLRKATEAETKENKKHVDIIELNELRSKIEGGESIVILDVREPAEFAFGHIPGSKNMTFGELAEWFNEMDKEQTLHVICRTGNRCDLAAQKLSEKGYKNVINKLYRECRNGKVQ